MAIVPGFIRSSYFKFIIENEKFTAEEAFLRFKVQLLLMKKRALILLLVAAAMLVAALPALAQSGEPGEIDTPTATKLDVQKVKVIYFWGDG